MREIDIIKTILSAFVNREYECQMLSECINQFASELDNALKRETDNHCYVGYYDNEEIEIVCDLEAYSILLSYKTKTKITGLEIYWKS